MDALLVLLCYWPVMRRIRISIGVIICTFLSFYMIIVLINPQALVVFFALMSITLIVWLMIELRMMWLAYKHINLLLLDRELKAEYDIDEFDQPDGLNLYPEDFSNPYDQEEEEY